MVDPQTLNKSSVKSYLFFIISAKKRLFVIRSNSWKIRKGQKDNFFFVTKHFFLRIVENTMIIILYNSTVYLQ